MDELKKHVAHEVMGAMDGVASRLRRDDMLIENTDRSHPASDTEYVLRVQPVGPGRHARYFRIKISEMM